MWIRLLNAALLAAAIAGPFAGRSLARDKPSPDPAIEDLRSDDVDIRRASANTVRASSRDARRKALPVLIDLLMKEKDGQVRLAVLDAITALGHDAEPAVAALIHTLKTDIGGQGLEASHQDYRSALALAAVGKPAVDGLRGILKERKPSVRAEAAMSLGRIGPDAEAAVPDLVALLGDKNERLRREASVALGRIGPAAVEPLIVACSQADPTVRASAIASLGLIAGPKSQVVAAVLKGANDSTPEVRSAALKSLAKLGLPDDVALPIVKENLRHEDENVRLANLDLLIGRRSLLIATADELESLLTSDNEAVSRQAAFLLRKIGPEAAPRLLNALRLEKSRIDPIAEALALLGRPAVGPLMRAVDDSNPRVRRGAALALGQMRPLAPGASRKLTLGLKDPDAEVRESFLNAIGTLGPRADDAVAEVRGMLMDPSARIRAKAIDILSQAAPHDDRLIDDLIARLADSDARVQRQAIDAVHSLGPLGRKALPDVIGKLESSDPEVRLAAVEMIGSHGQAASGGVPALAALLDDPSPKIRRMAAQTLGKLGKPAQPAFARLASLLKAEQPEIREAATSALGSLELDAPTLKPYLAKALRDEKQEVRRAASRAIQRLGPEGSILVPDIILLAGSKETLKSAERLLRPFDATAPDARAVPELIEQLRHDQEAVRLLAIKFLKLSGPAAKDAIPALERLRSDPKDEVRKQAEAALERIKIQK